MMELFTRQARCFAVSGAAETTTVGKIIRRQLPCRLMSYRVVPHQVFLRLH